VASLVSALVVVGAAAAAPASGATWSELAPHTDSVAPIAARTPDRLTCERYPQERDFVDSQAWWSRTPGASGTDFGHLHVGGCLPERETIRRTQRLDIRVVMHHNPGRLRYVSLVLKGREYEDTVAKSRGARGLSCPHGTCVRWLSFRLEPARFRAGGLQEVRVRAFVDEPDGNEMHTSINWQLHVRNGKRRDDVTRRAYLRGKGWYSGAGYCEAAYRSVPLPDGAPRSVWRPFLAMSWDGDASDLPVTGHSVRIDPDAHHGMPGILVREGAGELAKPVAIDLERLAPGRHRLVLRSDCRDPRGSTNSGLLSIHFDR